MSSPDVEARFNRKVKRGPGNACWLWVGTFDGRGYGQFSIGGRNYRAHRIAWELNGGGALSPDVKVCHRCDVPACVNPAHLFPGTQKDNLSDAARKGRMPLGERQGNSKLKTETILEIRRLRGTATQRDLARRFAISQATVSQILSRQRWPHV